MDSFLLPPSQNIQICKVTYFLDGGLWFIFLILMGSALIFVGGTVPTSNSKDVVRASSIIYKKKSKLMDFKWLKKLKQICCITSVIFKISLLKDRKQ